ncbi:MAG: ATP-dependent helicase [Alphaproteobacteria bacterium]
MTNTSSASEAVSHVLDPAQAASATCEAARQLTLAGPGAGKTTTLAGRFFHLVRNGVDPGRILAVTFTKKAADEMAARIAGLVRVPARRLPVMTFHAFAYRHLRGNPHLAGLREVPRIWDGPQQRQVFFSRQMWWNEDVDIFDIIAGQKERLVDAEAFARKVAEKPDRFPECYPRAVPFFTTYEAALRQAGAIDFADMVPMVVRAMTQNPEYRRVVTGNFDHLLIDEYQDVNPGQIALIDLFVADGVALWAVGDDDQTLFTFRASDIRHVLEFRQRYPGATLHVLDRNYRSTPDIVATAKGLIRRNRERTDKEYRSVLTEAGEIVIRGYSTPEVEARQVATAIRGLLSEEGMTPRKIAVLYRAGLAALPLQAALKEAGIPFEVRGSGDLWQSTAARLVVGSLYYLQEGPTVRAMSRIGAGRRALNIVERLEPLRTGCDFQESCKHVRRIVGAAIPGKAAQRERNEWTTLVDAVVDMAEAMASLAALEVRIGEQSAVLRDPPQHAVVLSTVHSAKGLEWDTVFLLGLEEGLWPGGGAEELEEERRIAYVALTRARRRVGLTYCAERYHLEATPSRFLREIHDGGRVLWSGPLAREADTRLPLATPEERQQLHQSKSARPIPPSGLSSPREKKPRESVRRDPKQRPKTRPERNLDDGLPARHGLPWTSAEENRLKRMFADHKPMAEMAQALERKPGGILSRLAQLGLLPKEDTAGAFEHRLTLRN